MTTGRLTVVGTGIGARRQLTASAEAAIAAADLVLHQVDDPETASWLESLNATAQAVSVPGLSEVEHSATVYEAIAHEVADAVAEGRHVCFVTYGHPGVYQYAGHRSMELVVARGRDAEMLPGISALDCLVADLGVDLAPSCHVVDATALVLQRRQLDPSSALVVFQVGLFGNPNHGAETPVEFALFADRLRDVWGPRAEAVIYEAPLTLDGRPVVHRVPLAELDSAPITARSLLYLAPSEDPEVDAVASAQIAAALPDEP